MEEEELEVNTVCVISSFESDGAAVDPDVTVESFDSSNGLVLVKIEDKEASVKGLELISCVERVLGI